MSKPSAPLLPAGAICEPTKTPIHGPAHEYIRLLRSYLSDAQKHFVRDQVEAQKLRGMPVTDTDYADLMQTLITPQQSEETVTFFAALCQRRGWLCPSP